MADAENILRELLKDSVIGGGNDVDVKALTSGGANYTSALYSVKVPSKELKLFAKVANIGEKMRAIIGAEHLYSTEQYIYTEVVKTFDRLQEKHDVPAESRFIFPKFFGCNPNLGEETVLLEDLTARGFRSYDRFVSVDWQHASSGVATLARFHALSFAYQREYPDEYQKVIEKMMFKPPVIIDENSKQAWVKMISSAIKVVTKKENRDKLVNLLNDVESYFGLKKPLSVSVLTHGDYRLSNLLFRNVNGVLEAIVVDYQTVHAGCPVADLLYFIFTGSDEEFRAKHYHQLLEHYYNELALALDRLKIDANEVYPKETFESELKEMLPHALRMTVVVLPIVTVEAADAPQMSGDADVSQFALTPNELFAQRFNGIVSDCVEWGVI